MRIKIAISDKKKGKIEIPLHRNKLNDLYDIMYMVEGSDAIDTIKLNKVDNTFHWFHKITDHLVHDILGDGVYGDIARLKTGKYRFISRGRSYLTKKPKWKIS